MSSPVVESDDTEVRVLTREAAQELMRDTGVDDQGNKRDFHGLRAISGKVCDQVEHVNWLC